MNNILEHFTGTNSLSETSSAKPISLDETQDYCFINSSFKLPIEYLEKEKIHPLSKIVVSDLEMVH